MSKTISMVVKGPKGVSVKLADGTRKHAKEGEVVEVSPEYALAFKDRLVPSAVFKAQADVIAAQAAVVAEAEADEDPEAEPDTDDDDDDEDDED